MESDANNKGGSCKARVVVEVSGGVVTAVHGDVEYEVLDWDNVEAGTPFILPEDFCKDPDLTALTERLKADASRLERADGTTEVSLSSYVLGHTAYFSKLVDDSGGKDTIDVFFFLTRAINNPDAATLERLIRGRRSTSCELDLFDGQEHSYFEVADWLSGGEEVALRLMGLGSALGLFKLLTPDNVLGDTVTAEMRGIAAEQGMITIVAAKKEEGE